MLIAITGHINAGKSTAAKLLVEHHGFVLIKFAQPIRDILVHGFGIREEDIEKNKNVHMDELAGQTIRRAMETLGTDWGRKMMGDALWINQWHRRYNEAVSQGKSVVVDDLRFENEEKLIRTLGGKIWKIVGPRAQKTEHESASYIDDIQATRTIVNNSGMRDYNARISAALKQEEKETRPKVHNRATAKPRLDWVKNIQWDK